MNLNPTLNSWKLKFSHMSWHFSNIYAPDDVIATYCYQIFLKLVSAINEQQGEREEPFGRVNSPRMVQWELVHTAISRKIVGKTVHATIPKGNMGYDQYTVPDTVAVEPTFVAFL